jgi:hypothetical protein
VSAYIYVEGGAQGPGSKDLDICCREGFHKLLSNCGFVAQRRMPRLVPCGGRAAAFEKFRSAHIANAGSFIALWVDGEEPMADIEAAWEHLQDYDEWPQPHGSIDEQVLFMTTCMETWFVADRETLKGQFKNKLQVSALPALQHLENRGHHEIQNSLIHATRNCTNAYAKGAKSYEILGKLSPVVLEQYLPSFVRVHRILRARL